MRKLLFMFMVVFFMALSPTFVYADDMDMSKNGFTEYSPSVSVLTVDQQNHWRNEYWPFYQYRSYFYKENYAAYQRNVKVYYYRYCMNSVFMRCFVWR
jgi:hypothetical protein